MKDRFTNGFLAGLLGGVAMSISNIISYFMGITEVLYLDWASVLIYGYRFVTLFEAVIGQVGQLFFSAVVGILFAYLLPAISSRYHLFKGWIFGLLVWFGSYAIVVLYKVTPLIPRKPDTVMSNMVTASLYGLVLAESLRRLSSMKEVK